MDTIQNTMYWVFCQGVDTSLLSVPCLDVYKRWGMAAFHLSANYITPFVKPKTMEIYKQYSLPSHCNPHDLNYY